MALSDSTVNNYATQLINRYVDQYEAKYGRKPNINRNALKHGFRNMVLDLGKARGLEVIDEYFELPRTPHEPNPLIYGYHEISQSMEELAEDADRRRKLAKETWERKQAFVQNRVEGS